LVFLSLSIVYSNIVLPFIFLSTLPGSLLEPSLADSYLQSQIAARFTPGLAAVAVRR